MKSALVLLCLLPVLRAHVVSMSSAELVVQGQQATYELHMPMYELTHASDARTALFDHVGFKGAERKSGQCQEQQGYFVCKVTYEFAQPVPDKLDATCTLFQLTVPNHVPLLHATQGNNGDQVVFDQRFTEVEIRFRPPSATEILVRDAAAGMSRLWLSVSGVIFLIALSLAAKTLKETALFIVLFIAAEWIVQPLAPQLRLSLSNGFLEAAMAFTGAYLAVDVLLLPEARSRWGIIPLLGVIHGLYYAAFPVHYLTGGSTLQAVIVVPIAILSTRLNGGVRKILMLATLLASLGWLTKLMVSGPK